MIGLQIFAFIVLPALFTFALGSMLVLRNKISKKQEEYLPSMKVGDSVKFYVDRTHMTGKITKINPNVKMKDGTTEDLVYVEVIRYKNQIHPL